MLAKLREESHRDPKGIVLRFYGKDRCHFEKDYVFQFEKFADCEDAWAEVKKRIESQKWTARDAKEILLNFLREEFVRLYVKWAREYYKEN